jgi:putative transposase
MEKWQEKYRIPTARATWWDYGNEGAYFVTFCTLGRLPLFGECKDGKIQLSVLGIIAQGVWHEIIKQFDYIELGAFVVMPNHIHGVLIISRTDVETRFIASNHRANETHGEMLSLITSNPITETTTIPTNKGGITKNKNPMLQENISRVIRWYKGRCTHEMRKIHADFQWQTRVWDNIIKNDERYSFISNYIIHNPANWETDKFYTNPNL